jgi:hypothetical protein
MADWSFIPSYVYTVAREPAKVLITRFEDGSELRRVKSSTNLRLFTEKFSVGQQDLAKMMGFWETALTNETFTKLDWDLSSGVQKFILASTFIDQTTVPAGPTPRSLWKVGDILKVKSSGAGTYAPDNIMWDGNHYAYVNTTAGGYISTNTTMSAVVNATVYRISYENEATVRFAKEPEIDQVAYNRWHLTWEFIEVA